MMFDWRSDIIANKELANRLADPVHGSTYFREVIQKYGAANYFHTVKLFHVFEFLHILQREKVITPKMWDGWTNNLLRVLEGSDSREIWEKLQEVGIFEPEFEAAVNAIIPGSRPTPPKKD